MVSNFEVSVEPTVRDCRFVSSLGCTIKKSHRGPDREGKVKIMTAGISVKIVFHSGERLVERDRVRKETTRTST